MLGKRAVLEYELVLTFAPRGHFPNAVCNLSPGMRWNGLRTVDDGAVAFDDHPNVTQSAMASTRQCRRAEIG